MLEAKKGNVFPSNSWKETTSFDHLDARGNVCIIAKDDFVYFIGGEKRFASERMSMSIIHSTVMFTGTILAETNGTR